MSVTAQTWILVAVMFAVTFGLRLTPFVVKARLKNNKTLVRLGTLMPVGIMVILVVYSFVGVLDRGLWPAVIGVVATAGLHFWRHEMLVSIVGGVAAYGLALLIL